MACLHLLRAELDCAIYVDTGYAYPETLALVEYAATMIPVHTVRSDRPAEVIPSDIVPADWTAFGQLCAGSKPVLIKDYHQCCFDYIARPIIEKAQSLGVKELVYGQRNDERCKSTARDGETVCGIVRRHPIENWTAAEVMDYLATKMDIPTHYAIKHSSLDCYDCTAYRKDSADRIEWMRGVHPLMYAKHAGRAAALAQALSEAS